MHNNTSHPESLMINYIMMIWMIFFLGGGEGCFAARNMLLSEDCRE